MTFDYALEPFSDWSNFRIGALLPNIEFPTIDAAKPPKKDIELGAPHTLTAASTIHLPQGYAADLPNPIHLTSPYGTFTRTSSLKDGALHTDRTLVLTTAKVPGAEWAEFKKFVDDIGVEPWIQVTSTSTLSPGNSVTAPPPAGENNPVAAELLRQAQAALQGKDRPLARKKLEQALSINDRQPYLWSMLGYLEILDNSPELAYTDYRRELASHPNELTVYPALIDAQMRLHKNADARLSLLAYSKAAPNDPAVALGVGNSLTALGNLSDALDVYRAAILVIPDNNLLKTSLGTALLRDGKPAEALPILKSALADTTDPLVLNNAAYSLSEITPADPSTLALAETASRKAVDLLEAESAQLTLESVNNTAFGRAQLLLSAWDTLGWILFQEGNRAAAESFIRAAWNSSFTPEVGLHLGQILEQQNDLPAAMRIYQEAMPRVSPLAAGLPPNPVATKLQARLDALTRRGIQPKPVPTEQEQRTFHVPRPANLKGSAVLLLLASTTEPPAIQLKSGDETLRILFPSITALDLHLIIPPSSRARLLRTGVLFCSTQPTCELVLTPPSNANIR